MGACKCNPPHALTPEERAAAEVILRNSPGVDNTAFMMAKHALGFCPTAGALPLEPPPANVLPFQPRRNT